MKGGEMLTVRHKAYHYAWQVTESNAAEVARSINSVQSAFPAVEEEDGGGVTIEDDDGWLDAGPGQWLVLIPDATFRVLSDESFREQYEVVGPTPVV